MNNLIFISTMALCIVGFGLKQIVVCDTWLRLIVIAIVFGVLGLAINSLIVLDKSARNRIIQKIRQQ